MSNQHWQPLGDALPQRQGAALKVVGRTLLRVLGWRIDGEIPNRPHLIIAVAPHTSNMDFILTLGVTWGLGLKVSFLAKHTLFAPPLGWFMRATGGIAVERSAAHGLVETLVSEFARRPRLVLGITPQGTRSRVNAFKSGFAHVARDANVPVLPAIVHWRSKTVRFGPLIDDVVDAERVVATVSALANDAVTID